MRIACILDLIERLDLLNSEIETITNHKASINQVRAWAHDRLSGSCNHLHHFYWSISYYSPIIFQQSIKSEPWGIFLNKNDVWVHSCYLVLDNSHKRLFLVYLCLYINDLLIVLILHIAKRSCQQQYPWIFYLCPHASVSYILFKDNSIYILAFLLINMLNSNYFDECVEVNRVI